VPTILIADDNSNIQKMVALAFKGEGIDVVAVGNGEAAVRKAPDLMPDLVLADIFMPVRNGYEVCEFIKQNTKLSHVPVILLTGAFDPFDEKEAQRVGADGVLKKPFVPPDPLVSLVKELLARSASMHLVPVSVAPEKASAPVSEPVAASIAPPEPAASREIPAATTAFDLPAEDLPTETGPEEVRPFKEFTYREEPGHSASEGGSSAFASLMDSGLGHRISFPEEKSALPVSEESETAEAPANEFSGFSSWLSKTAELDPDKSTVEDRAEEPPSTLYTPGLVKPARGWDIERTLETRPEDETIVEPMDHFRATHFPSHANEDSHEQPAAQEFETFPIYRAEAGSDESAATATDELQQEPIAEAVPDASDWVDMGAQDGNAAPPAAEAGAETTAAEHTEPASAMHSPFAMEDTQTIDAIRSSSMPWHSVPSAIREVREGVGKPGAAADEEYLPKHFTAQYSPRKHDDSAETLTGEPAFTEDAANSDHAAAASADSAATTEHDAPVYEAASETHGEFDSTHSSENLPAVIQPSPAESLSVAAPAILNAQQIEDIVSRVVERMQPQVLDVITKEILRPVVEALVRKQLEQK
jgi:CheY-like chemotaxis protein